MAGLLTKGIKLGYKTSSSATSYTDLTNLQEIPDLGGDVDTVEVTTLADAAHTYIAGLKDYGDSLDFVFLYDPTQFGTLNALTGVVYWQVSLPDGENGAIDTTCTFTGECNVRFDGKGTNEAMTYTLSITPNSAMTWA